MDLISQIVATKGNVEVAEVQNDLEKLSSSAASLKRKMIAELDSYPNLLRRAILINSTNFRSDISTLIDSEIKLEIRLKNLIPKDDLILESELVSMLEKIQSISETLLYLKNIDLIESLIKSVEDMMETDSLTAAKRLMDSKSIINKYIKVEGFNDFFKYAVEGYVEHYASLNLFATKKWSELVTFKHVKNGKKEWSSSLTIVAEPGNSNLNNIFQILQILQCPHKEEFQQHLFDFFLHPVLKNSCSIEITESCNGKSTLSMKYAKESLKMSFKNVVYSLIQIFQFINAHLDLKAGSDINFIMLIGLLCSDDFLNVFIQQHLSEELNVNSDYSEIIVSIKELLHVTREKGFVIKSNKLNDFLERIPFKRECKLSHYMNSAKSILRKNVYDLMHIESEVISLPVLDITSHKVHTVSMKTEFLADLESYIGTDKLQIFPECKISKSIDDLVKLLQTIFDNSLDCEDAIKSHMFKISQDIIYAYISANSHQSSIQHSALVFNNSMYLIMSLNILGKKYNIGFLFCGLNYKLQHLGFELLNHQIVSIQNTLTRYLQKVDLGNAGVKELPDKTNQLLVEWLHQFTLLQQSWINILPMNIYCMAIGYLWNGCIDELMSIELRMNVVGPELFSHYYQLFLSVKDNISLLFPEKSQLEKYIRSWGKLCELCRIFEGSLAVETFWNEGNGPLSHHFTNLQIKHLISRVSTK